MNMYYIAIVLPKDLDEQIIKYKYYMLEKFEAKVGLKSPAHITIATRDLHKAAFAEAWPYFKDKEFRKEWTVEGLSLLRHNKKNWDVIQTSQFAEL